MTRAEIQAISPFFIVSDVPQSVAFYRDRLGFEVRFLSPEADPFFAIVGRGGAQLFLKSDREVAPLPNPVRHPYMAWDAFVYAPEPDTLRAEFTESGVVFRKELGDTQDGLRGFEVADPNGYVLFFGRTL